MLALTVVCIQSSCKPIFAAWLLYLPTPSTLVCGCVCGAYEGAVEEMVCVVWVGVAEGA